MLLLNLHWRSWSSWQVFMIELLTAYHWPCPQERERKKNLIRLGSTVRGSALHGSYNAWGGEVRWGDSLPVDTRTRAPEYWGCPGKEIGLPANTPGERGDSSHQLQRVVDVREALRVFPSPALLTWRSSRNSSENDASAVKTPSSSYGSSFLNQHPLLNSHWVLLAGAFSNHFKSSLSFSHLICYTFTCFIRRRGKVMQTTILTTSIF